MMCTHQRSGTLDDMAEALLQALSLSSVQARSEVTAVV